jgi:hypothetical protein
MKDVKVLLHFIHHQISVVLVASTGYVGSLGNISRGEPIPALKWLSIHLDDKELTNINFVLLLVKE